MLWGAVLFEPCGVIPGNVIARYRRQGDGYHGGDYRLLAEKQILHVWQDLCRFSGRPDPGELLLQIWQPHRQSVSASYSESRYVNWAL